jgi:hypothetical protein
MPFESIVAKEARIAQLNLFKAILRETGTFREWTRSFRLSGSSAAFRMGVMESVSTEAIARIVDRSFFGSTSSSHQVWIDCEMKDGIDGFVEVGK